MGVLLVYVKSTHNFKHNSRHNCFRTHVHQTSRSGHNCVQSSCSEVVCALLFDLPSLGFVVPRHIGTEKTVISPNKIQTSLSRSVRPILNGGHLITKLFFLCLFFLSSNFFCRFVSHKTWKNSTHNQNLEANAGK